MIKISTIFLSGRSYHLCPSRVYLVSGPIGTESVGSVAFVTSPRINVKFGLNDPVHYCQPNPLVVTPCFTVGQSTAVPSAMALVGLPYDASGHDFTSTNPVAKTTDYAGVTKATFGQIGATVRCGLATDNWASLCRCVP